MACISPTHIGAIPANGTVAGALPTVAVVVRVSRDSGLDGAAAPEATDGWLCCCELDRCEIISTKKIAQANETHRLAIRTPFNCAGAFSWAGGRELGRCVCA